MAFKKMTQYGIIMLGEAIISCYTNKSYILWDNNNMSLDKTPVLLKHFVNKLTQYEWGLQEKKNCW